jgi:predicted DNA-binding transcriptional regulator AlpA
MKLDLNKTNGSSPPFSETSQPQAQPLLPADEIWTVDDVAHHLKLSRRQVWELTRRRGQLRSEHPIPVVRIHRKALRFRKSDVLLWLSTLAREGRVQ